MSIELIIVIKISLTIITAILINKNIKSNNGNHRFSRNSRIGADNDRNTENNNINKGFYLT